MNTLLLFGKWDDKHIFKEHINNLYITIAYLSEFENHHAGLSQMTFFCSCAE